MNKNRYLKQLFAADANMIKTTDLDPAISIDHNQKLVAGITSLMTVLGITDLTPMSAGTQVKQYKYTQKNTPAQAAEGEEIALTKFDRKLVNTFDLVLKKFRKQTTAEAIQRVGRNRAINDTDTLLLRNVQRDVKKDFFTALGNGTGTSTNLADKKEKASVSIQGAIAGIWADLSKHYEDMDVTPIYCINPVDVATYLANATVSIQTAFGFQYVENFLGMGTVIFDSSVTAGTVLGTVKENLNGVYIPAGGDVAQSFNLTSDSTGMVGMTHYTNGDNATVNTLLMAGVTFYAEDVAGVFKAKTAVDAAS